MNRWTGYGFLVPLLVFVGALCEQLVVDDVFGSGYYTAEAWPKLVFGFGVGVILWFVGNALNHGREEVKIDKKTGEEKVTVPNHTFVFLPVRYWSFIVMVLGLVLVLMAGE